MRSDFSYIQAINEIENNYGQATSGYGSAKLQLARTAFPSCTRAICAYKNDRRKVKSSNSSMYRVTRTGSIHRIGLLGLNVSCHRYLQAWTQNATILLIQHMHRSNWRHATCWLDTLPSLISFQAIKLMQLQVERSDGFQHIQAQVQSCCIINPSYRRTRYSKYPEMVISSVS